MFVWDIYTIKYHGTAPAKSCGACTCNVWVSRLIQSVEMAIRRVLPINIKDKKREQMHKAKRIQNPLMDSAMLSHAWESPDSR